MTNFLAVVVGVATFFSLSWTVSVWWAMAGALLACSAVHVVSGFVSAWLRDIQR